MAKYVLKRVLLMLFTFFVITTICFMLIRALPRELPLDKNQREVMLARFEALGYNEPLLTQYGIYLKNIFTAWDFGTSWNISFRCFPSRSASRWASLPPLRRTAGRTILSAQAL